MPANQPYPPDWRDPEFISGGARHALKIYSRRMLVGFVILLLGVGYAIHISNSDSAAARRAQADANKATAAAIVASGRAVVVDSCNRDFKSNGRLRGLLLRAEAEIPKAVKKGRFTPNEAKDALAFYNKELARIPLPDCRKAQNSLTDDPNKPIRQPVPLHP